MHIGPKAIPKPRVAFPTRSHALARLQRVLERMHSARLQMSLIVSLTAGVGFLASFLLLQGGVDSLALRYPIAVVIAYLAFLVFLWAWIRFRTEDLVEVFDIPVPDAGRGGEVAQAAFEAGGGQFGGGGASGSFADAQLDQIASVGSVEGPSLDGGGVDASDAASALDAEEIAFIIIIVVALSGAAYAAFSIIWMAPSFMAELLLDAGLATGLYARLKGVEGDHWLRTALRRTVWPFVAVALCFFIAGVAMQMVAPGAKSIGEVLSRIDHPS